MVEVLPFLLCSEFLCIHEIISLSLCSKWLHVEEESFYKFYFTIAKKNVNEYWLDLFLSNGQMHKYHVHDVMQAFQDSVLNRVTNNTYSYKTLSLFHALNFIYYPRADTTVKFCQTTCKLFGLLKSKTEMQLELQKVLNFYGRKKGDYYSCKNVLNSKLDTYETKCKSLQIAIKDITSHVKNIKKALHGAKSMDISWEDKCKRMKRSHAELSNRFHDLKKMNVVVKNTATHIDKKKEKANEVNYLVVEMKQFMAMHHHLEILFLHTIL